MPHSHSHATVGNERETQVVPLPYVYKVISFFGSSALSDPGLILIICVRRALVSSAFNMAQSLATWIPACCLPGLVAPPSSQLLLVSLPPSQWGRSYVAPPLSPASPDG